VLRDAIVRHRDLDVFQELLEYEAAGRSALLERFGGFT
jgi:hypothetical protein